MGICVRSAVACMRRADLLRPPSTRRVVNGALRSPSIALRSSAVWVANPSMTAVTSWARVVDSVMPEKDAEASGRHHGAASPARAGTNNVPSDSWAAALSKSVGAAINPSSVIHRIAEAAVEACPSTQYDGVSRRSHATEQVNPVLDRTALAPTLTSRNTPVPNVHLALPGDRHRWARSAACWSTMRPPTGAEGPKASVEPTTRSLATMSGSRSPDRPNRAPSSGAQSTVSRSVSSERLAVAASVTNAPVRWCTIQLSVVVTTPAVVQLARSHAILGAEKYGSRTRPVRCSTQLFASDLLRHNASARRSCHTSAVLSGAPLSGSHASTVSP